MDRAHFPLELQERQAISDSPVKGRVVPFLKWAGGKRWFVQSYASHFPHSFNRYVEPFLGSAAVFFFLSPENGIIADRNSELIETYRAVRDDWRAVSQLLEEHNSKHCKSYYYKLRDKYSPRSSVRRAALFIYMNRTCWNGLYRVNRNGKFNVPIGTKSNVVLATDDFQAVAELLRGMTIKVADFKKTIALAGRGDFVFVDPPYVTKRHNGSFIKYNEKLFAWEDQVALRDCLALASQRGAKILATNANNKLIRRLYEQEFDVATVSRGSVISGDVGSRGRCTELLIRNY